MSYFIKNSLKLQSFLNCMSYITNIPELYPGDLKKKSNSLLCWRFIEEKFNCKITLEKEIINNNIYLIRWEGLYYVYDFKKDCLFCPLKNKYIKKKLNNYKILKVKLCI